MNTFLPRRLAAPKSDEGGSQAKASRLSRPTLYALRSTLYAPPTSERGIALIIVLISIFVLAMLAGGFAIAMKTETKLARNANSETELEWLGRSGVEYARWILAQQLNIPGEPYDALSQVWAGGPGGFATSNSPLANVQSEVRMGNGSFTWKITDLERKFNINLAINNEDIVRQACLVVGIDAGETPALIGSVLDWLDKDSDMHNQGAETEYYQTLNPPYEAKNGAIDDLSELLLIKGITPEMYWGNSSTNHPRGVFQKQLNRFGVPVDAPSYPVGLMDIFTPISTGKININTASATTLQVMGVDNLIAEGIVSAREGEDDGTGQTGPFRSLSPQYLWSRVPGLTLEMGRQLQRLCDVRSRTFEVQIDAEISGYKRQFIAILGRNNQRDVQVLNFYWK